jgi:RNA polymerase sigma-70 factor (ECF subfamily)
MPSVRPVTPPLSVLLLLILWRQSRPVATRTTDPRTDEALYLQYTEGDHRAFRELLARHGDAVYRFLGRQIGDWDMAADLTQEVFLKVITAGQDFRGDASFRTWLFQVARNAAIDAVRFRRRRPDGDARSLEAPPVGVPEAPPLGERLAEDTDGGDQRTLLGEQCRALEAGLERLPPEQREAFLLREMEGLSFPEIGGIQGVGLDTARSRVQYALKSLRRSLDGFGGRP